MMTRMVIMLWWAGVCISVSSAKTISLNSNGTGDYATIQAAINAAKQGDVITLSEGVYTGAGNTNFSFKGKALTLRSEEPESSECIAATIIDARGTGVIARFISDEGPDTIFEGFTLKPGDVKTPVRGVPGFFELSPNACPTTRRLSSAPPPKSSTKVTAATGSPPVTVVCPSDDRPPQRSWDGTNPFMQPANTTNYYGSGDLNLDGVVTAKDRTIMQQIIAGTSQKNIRADIDGDGAVNNSDLAQLDQAIAGGVLPAWWNQLTKIRDRNEWIDRVLALDKTSQHEYIGDYFVCHHFASQFFVHAAFERSDSSVDSTEYNGGQTIYNLPVYLAMVGSPMNHVLNAVLIANNPLNFSAWRFIEPQNDTDVAPGAWNMPYGSVISIGNRYTGMGDMVRFYVDAAGGQLISYDSSLATERPSAPAAALDNLSDLWHPALVPSRGTATVTINQQTDGRRWNVLGTFPFNAGQDYRVTVTAQPSPSNTCADAVQFVPIASEIVIDNDRPGTSSDGTWQPSSAAGSYGDDSLWARDGATYTWTFSPATSGSYDVSMWWTEWSSRSDSVPVRIEHAGGAKTIKINQQTDGGKWNLLGSFSFNAGRDYRVTITAQPGPSSTCADALRFTPAATIIDNGQPGTFSTGSWQTQAVQAAYGTESLWARDGATYTWTFSPAVSGDYEVSMWWTASASRSDSVPVQIQNAAGGAAVFFEKMRDDMSRTTDIHVTDFDEGDFDGAAALANRAFFSRILDVKRDTNGHIHLLFESKDGGGRQNLFYGAYDGADDSLTDVSAIVPNAVRLPAMARLLITDSGQCFAFWLENHGHAGSFTKGIHWTTYEDGGWRPPQALERDIPQGQTGDWLNRQFAWYAFDVEPLSGGRIMLVCVEEDFPDLYLTQFIYSSGAWTKKRIEQTYWSFGVRGLDLCRSPDGTIHLAYWRSSSPQCCHLESRPPREGRGNVYHRAFNGTAWSSPAAIDASMQAAAVRIQSGSDNTVYAIWEQRTDEAVVPVWNRYENGAWQQAQTLNVLPSFDAWYPVVAPLPGGRVLAAWSARSDDLVTIETAVLQGQ